MSEIKLDLNGLSLGSKNGDSKKKNKRGNDYVCYSRNQFKFLVQEDNYPIKAAVHHITGRQYWVFQRDSNLDRALTKWQLKFNKQ